MTEPSLKISGKLGTLFIWDVEGSPPVGDWKVVLWRNFAEYSTPEIISIPRLVEMHADELRARYLALIYELGELRTNDQRLIDKLEMRPGFSAWWMSLMVEMSYGKSPVIYESIRMMAFEIWAKSNFHSRVVLASPSVCLAECMRSWCNGLGIAFEWQRMQDETEKLSLAKRFYRLLPHPLRALIWLIRHLLQCWPLRGKGLMQWRETEGQVTFVSYLFNLVPDAAKKGRFESRYWAHLPDELQREGCKTNWIHLYVKDALLPNARMAADAIHQFNETGRGGQIHVTLDTFLGFRVVIRTLLDWWRLMWVGRRLQQSLSSHKESALDLWPLFQEDWNRSMSGQVAMSNVLFLNLFETALESLPKQHIGIYLQENQGWEFAFIRTWKAVGHGRLIGAPHSTVRFWDLRYFFDPRSYRRTGDNDLPLPDQVAVNGTAMKDVYQKGGYLVEEIVEVEALRYLYLCENKADPGFVLPVSYGHTRLLVLGDYLLSNTQQQLRLLEKALQHLSTEITITVKPHPNCPVQPGDYPGIRMTVTIEPVSKLLTACDVAYTSCVTSAAVDAYCAGVPVISLLDPDILNLSPLRGNRGVTFASTPEQLANALIRAASSQRFTAEQKNFFTLDSQLPRWRELLGMEHSNSELNKLNATI